MKLLYIGAGFVGTCSAAVAADSGHEVLIYDIDKEKVKNLGSFDRDTVESVLFEEGLGDTLAKNKERIKFTHDNIDLENFIDKCEAIFICVPTSEIDETGETDLSHYNSALEFLSKLLVKRNTGAQDNYLVIINKSTVPINLVMSTENKLKEAGVINFGVVSNPEFLVEGKAMFGSLKPDRVVIGAWNERDFVIMRRLYQRFYDSPTVQYIEVNPMEAAAGKLLANFYLFNKLAVCYDVIGRTCEAFSGVKFESIRKILTTDARIGEWGFFNSLYAGGSCFIKDARSLAHQLKSAGHEHALVNEVYLSNKRQLDKFINRPDKELNYDWKGKVVSILGLAFKRNTNDIRNSPSVNLVKHFLSKDVAEIRLYDPAAHQTFKKLFPENDKIKYVVSEKEAIANADVVILATDWPQFRSLSDLLLEKPLDKKVLIMDGRRILQHSYELLQSNGYDIIAVGSPLLKASEA